MRRERQVELISFSPSSLTKNCGAIRAAQIRLHQSLKRRLAVAAAAALAGQVRSLLLMLVLVRSRALVLRPARSFRPRPLLPRRAVAHAAAAVLAHAVDLVTTRKTTRSPSMHAVAVRHRWAHCELSRRMHDEGRKIRLRSMMTRSRFIRASLLSQAYSPIPCCFLLTAAAHRIAALTMQCAASLIRQRCCLQTDVARCDSAVR